MARTERTIEAIDTDITLREYRWHLYQNNDVQLVDRAELTQLIIYRDTIYNYI